MLLSLDRRQILPSKQKIAEQQECTGRHKVNDWLLGVLEEECQEPLENSVNEPS